MIAAIYVRVSTVDQHDALQLAELREYCTRMGWTIVEYAEKMSAVKKRPVLDALMIDAKRRKFDIVVVWKLDRFARSLAQLVGNIQALDSAGVRFIALTQSIDTDKHNPVSRLMLHVLGAVAEFERSLIVERVKAGVAEARKHRADWGRPKRIFNRDEVLKLRKRGLTLRAIAKKLGLPLTTVARELKEGK